MSIDQYAAALADAVDRALEPWVQSCVVIVARRQGLEPSPELVAAASEAGRQATADVMPRLHELLAADVDAQWTTPLAVVRAAARFPTAVLRDAGVPPVERDGYATARFPDDLYDLTPATFADLGPDVGEAAVEWGAAKAFVHRARHSQREGTG